MRLLIITQKVDKNDDVFSFFHRWIVEFAKHCEQVTVVALGVGEFDLPQNVHVFSLGKESGASRLTFVAKFYSLIWRERNKYDVVFVHMNPVYVILGGIFWRLWNKKIALWYTHKNVDLRLRIAEKFTNIIFSASKESFRLPSKKLLVVGHGIDIEVFKPLGRQESETLRVITAGRISPVKNLETLFEAMEILLKKNIFVHAEIIGDIAQKSDEKYFAKLKTSIHEKGLEQHIHFTGKIPNQALPQHLALADVFVNMSETGSLDKGVLEAMALELPTITSNEAFRTVFSDDYRLLMFPPRDAQAFANKLQELMRMSGESRLLLAKRLRQIIIKKHDLKLLIPKILDSMLSLK